MDIPILICGFSSICRTVGMFEQNNVGVQMKMPVAEAVEAMLAPGAATDPAAAAYLKDSLQRIIDNIDGTGFSPFFEGLVLKCRGETVRRRCDVLRRRRGRWG
jgi:hypothetical protein